MDTSPAPPREVGLLWVPCPDKATAITIARALVASHAAACANLISGGLSIYPWEGEVQVSEEVYLLVKTTTAKLDAAKKQIESLHPYACPCILQLHGGGANEDWLRWLHATVSASSP